MIKINSSINMSTHQPVHWLIYFCEWVYFLKSTHLSTYQNDQSFAHIYYRLPILRAKHFYIKYLIYLQESCKVPPSKAGKATRVSVKTPNKLKSSTITLRISLIGSPIHYSITLMNKTPPRGLGKWLPPGSKKPKISGNIIRTSCKR